MKNKKVLLLNAIFIGLAITSSLYAQLNVRGSGYVLTQQRETSNFTTIIATQGIKVFVAQGDLQPVIVEADDNLFPYIKTVVKNEVLKIYIADTVNITKYSDMNILITVPQINQLKANTGARIEGSGSPWNTSSLNTEVSGEAYIKWHIEASKVNVEAKNAGTVELKGTTGQLHLKLKTAAQFYGRELKAGEAFVEMSTSSRAEIEVQQKLEYSLSSHSRLQYKGNPVIIKPILLQGSKITHEK